MSAKIKSGPDHIDYQCLFSPHIPLKSTSINKRVGIMNSVTYPVKMGNTQTHGTIYGHDSGGRRQVLLIDFDLNRTFRIAACVPVAIFLAH
jgi:hypothetical protein